MRGSPPDVFAGAGTPRLVPGPSVRPSVPCFVQLSREVSRGGLAYGHVVEVDTIPASGGRADRASES